MPATPELILCHEVLKEELKNPIYGNSAKKHLFQNSSLLAHLESAKLIQDNTCFIEFGAGKGTFKVELNYNIECILFLIIYFINNL